jgi:hypothetical protein
VKKVVLFDQARADLVALDRASRLRIAAADIRRIQGINPPEYRLRVGDHAIRIHRIRDRKDSYR